MESDINSKKIKMLKEISNLSHIGRSQNDIAQALTDLGYDKSQLNEILTVPFMESLVEKEERFVHMQMSAVSLVAKQREEEKNYALRKKSIEEQAKKHMMEEEVSRNNEDDLDYAEDEKKRNDLYEQNKKGEYWSRASEEDLHSKQYSDEQDKKQEEVKRLREMY